MGTVIAVLAGLVALVVALDRLLRGGFRQEGEDTVGASQRISRGGPPRPLGEVIDEATRGPGPPSTDGEGSTRDT